VRHKVNAVVSRKRAQRFVIYETRLPYVELFTSDGSALNDSPAGSRIDRL
jgi:hypothetical protein